MEIGGVVEDEARIPGQALVLGEDAEVGDDLVAASFSLEKEPGSTVGRRAARGVPGALGWDRGRRL